MITLGLVETLATPVLPNHLQVLPVMPAALPMPLVPSLLSVLERMEPGSETFLSTLEQFLRSKEDHKLLEQLEGSDAVCAADILEKVRDRAVVSCNA